MEKLEVIEGFAADGHPILRPAGGPVLLRQLLTHTSGFAYDNWDAEQFRYTQYLEKTKTHCLASCLLASIREPSGDTEPAWIGPGGLVEAVSGVTLEAWFQNEILQPLGMNDTSFILQPAKFDRLMSLCQRQSDGALKEQPRKMPDPPKSFNGGGGLFSTPEDYVKFMQMILRRGSGPSGKRILRRETVDLMAKNHAGAFSAGKLKTMKPLYSCDMDMHPGHTDGFGYGFLINSEKYDGGRSAGSLAGPESTTHSSGSIHIGAPAP